MIKLSGSEKELLVWMIKNYYQDHNHLTKITLQNMISLNDKLDLDMKYLVIDCRELLERVYGVKNA